MCPIRHFDSIVKFVDAWQGFVFAADDKGRVAIFLISENDLENDNDTMKVWEIRTAGVEFLKFISHN
jgi:hypothetical protein